MLIDGVVLRACVYLLVYVCCLYFFFFKQKTAYEMRISDWSSDVCSSDLRFLAIRWEVEKGRLRFFAKAIGETRPEFIDEDAAKAAGHPSLLAPPTILFSGPLDHDDVPTLLQMLGIDMNNILHGEQGFTYHAPIHAGDVLAFDSQINDIPSKKGGALELVTRESRVTNQRGELVATVRNVVAVVNR